jgi:hypothetical protein
MMSEEWTPVVEFPRYEVSTFGDVRDTKTNRIMKKTVVQKQIPTVGLVRDGYVCRRSVPLLVASHWLLNEFGEAFDTPIQLDGDRSNCHIENLMWRPRWFAVNYHKEKLQPELLTEEQVVMLQTGEVFDSVRQASINFGFMERDIIQSMDYGVDVWPGHVNFDYY